MDKNIFGDRLRQERTRLGLTQEAFAAIGGVKKLAQINYEQGKTLPDAGYMVALAGIGVDLSYVMLGVPASNALTDDENELLAGYRRLDLRGKARVLGVVEGIGEPAVTAPSRTVERNTQMVFHGKVGQQIHGDITAPQTINVGRKKKSPT
ncbi:helix-turn-helix transcriptional regulator [Janthinobacterium sp. KBS0711]|uniref:helix-turn-helix domain-containing protein n=1 Tax=Janthinobacterium sp. KBS0711 TaxID=1649647 RepID=UPI000627CC0E|nr:helix-turn-helix transcriptional regulator [Janthinobacterium sp. KBS0711]TSD71183.1 helix-turn-helix transcriptional regulator [Janthinobacterium sp. KBS0711]